MLAVAVHAMSLTRADLVVGAKVAPHVGGLDVQPRELLGERQGDPLGVSGGRSVRVLADRREQLATAPRPPA